MRAEVPGQSSLRTIDLKLKDQTLEEFPKESKERLTVRTNLDVATGN